MVKNLITKFNVEIDRFRVQLREKVRRSTLEPKGKQGAVLKEKGQKYVKSQIKRYRVKSLASHIHECENFMLFLSVSSTMFMLIS